MTKQETMSLLKDPVAVALLQSAAPARLAYVGLDGTPRAVPIWFHWNGSEFVLVTGLASGKVRAISKQPKVAFTIDADSWPYKILQVRGTAKVETVDGIVPEYALAAERYFGAEQGKAWISQIGGLVTQWARIAVTPEWVSVIDIEQRFANAGASAPASE
ncbi:MAG: pyridoxamine 5'-phosphate oxidase family protein [Tepidiformaceae bacterium]